MGCGVEKRGASDMEIDNLTAAVGNEWVVKEEY